jgi:hypothetical protein
VSSTEGTVAKLWRYPVKSMLGEERDHLDVDERGVEGDRADFGKSMGCSTSAPHTTRTS